MDACSDANINRPIPAEFIGYVGRNPIVAPPVLVAAAAPPAPAVAQPIVDAAPVRRAGIIIHLGDTYLMGKNGTFAISNQYNPPGDPRTVGQFIDSFPTISRIDMIDYCKARLTLNPIVGIANYQTLCATPIMQINPVFDFVKNYLINDFILNRNYIIDGHIVNNKTSVRIYQYAGRWSFPKGGFNRNVDGLTQGGQLNLLETALREFKEEIGCDLRSIHELTLNGTPLVAGHIVNINTLYDIGNANGYKTYYMCVNAATAALIMGAVPAHQNNSELFDIRFRPYPVSSRYLQEDSDPMKNRIPAGLVCGQVYRQPYVPPHARELNVKKNEGSGTFQSGPVGRANGGAGINSDSWRRGGSIYKYKLQKYQNKLNKN